MAWKIQSEKPNSERRGPDTQFHASFGGLPYFPKGPLGLNLTNMNYVHVWACLLMNPKKSEASLWLPFKPTPTKWYPEKGRRLVVFVHKGEGKFGGFQDQGILEMFKGSLEQTLCPLQLRRVDGIHFMRSGRETSLSRAVVLCKHKGPGPF